MSVETHAKKSSIGRDGTDLPTMTLTELDADSHGTFRR
jgi:hypothetical protein